MIKQNLRELLEEKVTLDIEGIDRLYLNAYQPMLQTGGGVSHFFRKHRGAIVASTTLMAPMSKGFIASIHRFIKENALEKVRFFKGQRKDEETKRRLKDFHQTEGVLYVGVAQEKFNAFRVIKKHNPETGTAFPWLFRSTVMCNQYYFYLVDDDFGPLFIKFSSYFPYTARISLNGHEYAKRQLEKAGIAYEALDNGVLSCENPERLQQILDALNATKIERMVRKWFARLPHPFTLEDRAAGFRYQISMLQAEFARTQVFDRPLSGRQLFEEVIRENIDLGRPQKVSLIFDRRITKRTPGRFATRVITHGVIPTLHVSYKTSGIKQYFKEERALRTETTINNSRDFAIGRLLKNLAALREIGFNANRRLLEVEMISQDCQLGNETFEQVNQPQVVDGQRASAMKFGDTRIMALFQALCLFSLLPQGFRNANLREHVAKLLGLSTEAYSRGRMTYDLRRLRLHGIIAREDGTNRYHVTHEGMRICLFMTKVHLRIIRPGCSQLMNGCPKAAGRVITAAMNQLDKAIEQMIMEAKVAA
jgi:hypothetical protein